MGVIKRMIKTLTAFFKGWNKDFLDDDTDCLDSADLKDIKFDRPILELDSRCNEELFMGADDDSFYENIQSDFLKANPPKEGSRFRKLFVDFADYDHFPSDPSEEDIEMIKAEAKIPRLDVLPSKEDLFDGENEQLSKKNEE